MNPREPRFGLRSKCRFEIDDWLSQEILQEVYLLLVLDELMQPGVRLLSVLLVVFLHLQPCMLFLVELTHLLVHSLPVFSEYTQLLPSFLPPESPTLVIKIAVKNLVDRHRIKKAFCTSSSKLALLCSG